MYYTAQKGKNSWNGDFWVTNAKQTRKFISEAQLIRSLQENGEPLDNVELREWGSSS